MSTTIDQRVVEMRFDNKQFEQNVSTTMSTLDKLKQKLNFDGATKGLENVNDAAKGVKMSGLGSAVDAVSAKFSALQVMGVTALANITNSAVNAGKRIIKSLTIDPIKSGFEEYETKMGSIQTILANTEHQGTTLDDVTAALNELNTYADKTIYNFQQMTKNIGTFTAAGVDLDTSVRSIQGIANLAAVSGSTSQQASTAMYQLSQALASGTVKLMDWNSVVNAGMGGKVFQNALIRTAAMLDGSASDVEAWQKKHVDAYGSFRESLTKDAWITSEVLTTTLEQFTMAAEEGSKEWEAYKKSLMDTGYSETQAEEILKMANTATDAATKVKTFTQLLDTLKESAQSGWAQTWELIVGDFEEAKSFFTELSDLFGGIIGKSADRRNTFFGDALTSNWDKLLSKISEAGIETSKFEESIRKVVGDDKLDTLIENYGSLEKVVRAGAVSSDTLKKALAGITDPDISDFVDGLKEIESTLRRGSVGDEVKKLQTALNELGYDLGKAGVDGILGPITEKAVKAFQEANGILADGVVGPDTLKALEKAGTKVADINGDVKDLTSSCSDLVDVITEKSGRELLLDSLMNIIKAIQRPLTAVGEALRNTFSISPKQLYSALESLNAFTKKLVLNDKSIDKVRRTFEGLFAIVDIIATVMAGPLKLAFNVITNVLGKMGLTLLDVTASVGDTFVELRNSVDKVVGTITNFIAEHVGAWVASFKETEFFNTVAKWFEDAKTKIVEAIDSISEKLSSFETSKFVERLRTVKDFLHSIGDSLKNSKVFTTIIDAVCGAFAKLKDFFGKFALPEFSIDGLKTFFTNLGKIFDGISISGSTNVFGAIGTFFTNFKKGFIDIKWTTFKNNALQKFVEFYLKTGDKIKAGFEKCKEILQAVAKFIFGADEVTLPQILDVAQKFLMLAVMIKALDAISDLTAPFDNITDALKNLASSVKWNAIASAFKAMALTLGIFTLCIVALVAMDDMEKAKDAAILLGGMLVGLAVIITAMGYLSSKIGNGWEAMGTGIAMIAIIGALFLLVKTIKEIDNLKLNDPQQTFTILFGALLALAIGIKAVAKAGSSSFKSVAAILTMLAALKLMLDVIDAYDNYDWTGKAIAIQKMIEMLLILSVAVNIASRGVKAGSSASGLALLLLSMVISLKLLLGAIQDFAAVPEEEIMKGGKVVFALLGALTAMLAVVNLTSKGTVLEKGQKSVNSFAGFAIALLAVVAAIYLLGKMDIKTLEQGGYAVGQIILLFTVMLAAVGKACSGLKMAPLIAMLVGFAGLMILMKYIIKDLQSVPWESQLASAGALSAMMLAMAGVLNVLTKHNYKAKSILKWIGALTALTGLMAVLGFVLYSIKGMDPLSAIGNAVGLSILLGAMTGVLYAISGLDMRKLSKQKMTNIVGMFAGLVLVLFGLSAVLRMLKGMDPLSAIGSAIALGTLLSVMTGVLFVVSKLKVGQKDILGLTVAVAALAALGLVVWEIGAIIRKLSAAGLDGSAIGTVGVISAMLIVMTGVLAACTGLGVILQNPMVMLGLAVSVAALALLGLVIWEIGAIIRKLSAAGLDGNAIGAVNVISAMLIVMTGVLAACTGLGIILQNPMVMLGLAVAIAALALLGLVVWEIGAIIRKLSEAGLDSSAIGAVNVISAMLIVMTGVLAACAVIGVASIPAAGAIAALALLGLVVWEIGAIIRKLNDAGLDSSAIGTVNVLSAMLIVMTGVLAACAVIGFFSISALSAVAVLAILGLVVWEIGAIIRKLNEAGLDSSAIGTVIILTSMLNTLVDTLVVLAIIGPFAAIGVGALYALTTLMGALGIAAIAIGVAFDKIKGLDTILDTGMAVIIKLASSIGEMIAAFMKSATSSLPTVADNLSQFADKLGPFVSAVSGIGDDVATGAGNLMKAILAITAADVISDIVAFFSGGNISLSSMAEELNGFAKGAQPFMDAMAGMNTNATTGVTALCNALSALTEANLKDALTNLLPGDNSLSTFGEGISDFAAAINDASISLAGISDEDVENVKRAAKAGEALASLNKAIPAQGGIWQDIAGEKDLSNWGQKISAFADSLVAYSAKVQGATIDSAAIQKSAEAGQALADLNGNVPKSGGAWQDIAGESDMATWGGKLVAFADSLVDYSNKVTGAAIDTGAITESAKAALALADVNEAIPTSGGLIDAIAGGKDMSAFGSALSSLATGITDYAKSAAELGGTAVEDIKKSGDAVTAIKEVTELLPDDGGISGMLWGEKNPKSFGQGVSALATGITDAVSAASAIDGKVDSIDNIGKALTSIKDNVTDIPEVDTTAAANFKTGVSYLQSTCNVLNIMCAAKYDFSGIETLKKSFSSVSDIFADLNVESMYSDANWMLSVARTVQTTATTLSGLNGVTYGGVDTFKGALNSLAEANVDGVIQAFSGKAESINAAITVMVSTMAKGLSGGATTVSAEAGKLASAAVSAVSDKKGEMETAGSDLAAKVTNGIKDKYESAKVAGRELGTNSVSGVNSQRGSMSSAGKDLGSGLVAGINAMKPAVYQAGYDLGRAAVQGEKDGQNSASPSKETIKAGKWLGEGLVIGMDKMSTSVYNAGSDLGKSATRSVSSTISSIADAISTDIDAQPTIRPVLDLSDVRSGASAISGMFNSSASVGVRANVGAISSMMNARSQNGVNADVVSAIDKLSQKMDNMGNTTYSVNGVTYDDGSNVSSAIQSLVRYAKIERRV